MEREVMWVPWEGPGLEHLRLRQDQSGILADGIVIGLHAGRPFRFGYRIRCDARWRALEVTVGLLSPREVELALVSDGQGRWATPDGQGVSAIQGAIDVDVSATPFTNTLPIRRLGLKPGQSAELSVAYIAVPELRLETARQRYTCLESRQDGGRYRYESPARGFSAELVVDREGLVIDYPGLFRRVWPGLSEHPPAGG